MKMTTPCKPGFTNDCRKYPGEFHTGHLTLRYRLRLRLLGY